MDSVQEIKQLHNEIAADFANTLVRAIRIGELLSEQRRKCTSVHTFPTFEKWLNESDFDFNRQTAYQYIGVYENRKRINAPDLNTAYKQLADLRAKEKQTENQKANQRVAEYKKTGVKPEGWRQHTDDKLAKEEQERDNRINDYFEEVKRREAEQQRAEAERNQTAQDIELLSKHFANEAETIKKRIEFKEKIRLSADGMKDPFQDAILDYLNGLENDTRRIEACYNIIKICKKIANELQVSGGAA
jgi:flagellar biosynthesis GTPase FlhF